MKNIEFQGDIQMLKIADTPDEAYEICTKHARDCLGTSGSYISGGSSYSGRGSDFTSGSSSASGGGSSYNRSTTYWSSTGQDNIYYPVPEIPLGTTGRSQSSGSGGYSSGSRQTYSSGSGNLIEEGEIRGSTSGSGSFSSSSGQIGGVGFSASGSESGGR